MTFLKNVLTFLGGFFFYFFLCLVSPQSIGIFAVGAFLIWIDVFILSLVGWVLLVVLGGLLVVGGLTGGMSAHIISQEVTGSAEFQRKFKENEKRIRNR